MSRSPHRPRLLRVLAVIGMTGVLASAALSFAEDQPPAPADESSAPPESGAAADDVTPSIALNGSVWRTKPGIAFLKTPVGLLTLSSKTTLKDFRASQDVSFRIHGPHLVIDIRKRTDGSLVHRYLSGPITRGPDDDKTLRRWTPDGEKSFHLGTLEQSLTAFRDGDVVTVEVDESDTVIGLHDLQFDLQIGQIPASGSHAHLVLTGTISKLKSNFIFFRTPVGVVNVNAKVGIKNPKVGQTMTLRMHAERLVADLSAPNTSGAARRFVTGPLEFASPDHASVKLWTPDGEQTYPADRGKALLTGVREGSPITVELNDQGTVVGFHRPD
ncbi:MAG TPA: hypothetical protein VD738_03335 [Nitrospira sp.]|nr:hypothetical protein [Nitrospira sp.]